MEKSELDEFGLLDDKSKADVLRTKISETEMTKRKVIEEQEKTKRDPSRASTRETFIIAFTIASVILGIVICVTIYNILAVRADVRNNEIRAEHSISLPASSASASK